MVACPSTEAIQSIPWQQITLPIQVHLPADEENIIRPDLPSSSSAPFINKREEGLAAGSALPAPATRFPGSRGISGIDGEMLAWLHRGSQPRWVAQGLAGTLSVGSPRSGFGPAPSASQQGAEAVYSQGFSPHRLVCRRRTRNLRAPQQAASGLPFPKGDRIILLPAKIPLSI